MRIPGSAGDKIRPGDPSSIGTNPSSLSRTCLSRSNRVLVQYMIVRVVGMCGCTLETRLSCVMLTGLLTVYETGPFWPTKTKREALEGTWNFLFHPRVIKCTHRNPLAGGFDNKGGGNVVMGVINVARVMKRAQSRNSPAGG